jgi:tetratricopeptide (TPR) repeat protein
MARHLRQSWRALPVIVIAALGIAFAQLSPKAQELLTQAQAAASQAEIAYANIVIYTPDQPLWHEALQKGDEALELAPDSPKVLRFLAETYSTLKWYSRAWDYWQRYQKAGGMLDQSALKKLSEAGEQLGFSRYKAGDAAGALGYYQKVYKFNPDDNTALSWLGRINFEQGKPKVALPYWQKLVKRTPKDKSAQYYLARTQQQVQVGIKASDAFYAGLDAYHGSKPQEALSDFQKALGFNAKFKDALSWAGRVSLELSQPKQAADYWQKVLALDPDEASAKYFLKQAQTQISYGVQAAKAFQDGQALYKKGDVKEALEKFLAAAKANPKYEDALVWTARCYQELSQPKQAAGYWKKVLALDPKNENAQYFLSLAQDQITYGVSATNAFNAAYQAYQKGDLAEAEKGFKQATKANPNYAAAWSWLGRVYFDQTAYDQAAKAYQQALELDPDNQGYAFFAGEAQRLAAPVSSGAASGSGGQ